MKNGKNLPQLHLHLDFVGQGRKRRRQKRFYRCKLHKRGRQRFEQNNILPLRSAVMTDFCVEALHSLNVRPRDIRREMFGTRQDIQNEPGFPQELSGTEVFKLKVGDKIIDAKCNESILCALERAGVRVNVCCRSGECSLCRVKLVSGKVFMPRGVLLRHADEMFGYIHSCKAYPIGDVEIAL